MTCIKCQHSTVKKFGRYGRHRIQRYRCTSCSTTFSDPKPTTTLPVRVDEATALQAVQCLIEGCSLRSTERLTGLHRDTIMRLLILAGERCEKLLDARMRNLKCKYIQCDEIWTFCFKKQRRVRNADPAEFGDQWVFVAIDEETKLVPTFVVGKRSRETTYRFMADLEGRILDRTQLTTDGFHFYERAVENIFAGRADFAQLIKLYGDYGQFGNERYSPGRITEVISKIRDGRPDPDHISTSHVERQNLTMRMQMRRFTRLTNAFSKKLDNLKAAIALHFGFYNFCRVHKTLRITPAMEAGLTDHVWNLAELLQAA